MKKQITIFIISACVFLFCSCSGIGAKSNYKKGIEALNNSDYETAESFLSQAMAKGYDDDSTKALLKCIEIYISAQKDFDGRNYADALSQIKSISKSYKQFESFREDVDELKSELEQYSKNIELYDQAMRFYENNMYDSAAETALKIDSKYLSNAQKDSVTLILKSNHIENNNEQNEEKNHEQIYEEQPYNNVFSTNYVKQLMYNYAWRLIDAINANSYSLVSPYIYPGSNLNNMQAKLITNLNKQGTTERMDSLEVTDIYTLNETMCAITTYEVATIFYSNGTSETKTYSWKYTAKIYKDGSLRLTNIERN